MPDYNVTTFSMDFKDAIYKGMDYLLSLGHEKIGFLAGVEVLDENEIVEDERLMLCVILQGKWNGLWYFLKTG